MKLVDKCPICYSIELKKLKQYIFKATERDIKNPSRLGILIKDVMKTEDKAIFIISLCQNCGFIFLNPTYSEEELNSTLRKTEERSKKVVLTKSLTKFKNLSKNYRVNKLVKKYFKFNSQQNPKILDFGGRNGYSLIPFLGNFECYVLDLGKFELPKGVHYIGNNLKNLNNNEKFDIVFMLHTLEHVHNPREILEEVSVHLNDNGIIIIKVPLGCVNEWRTLPKPSYHINFFSEESLYNCIRLSRLQVLYIKTEFVKYGSIRIWQLTAIATNRRIGPFKSIKSLLSTNLQRKLMIFYYFPLIINKENFNVKVIKNQIFTKILKRESSRLNYTYKK